MRWEDFINICRLMDKYKWYFIIPMLILYVEVIFRVALSECSSEYEKAQKEADYEKIAGHQKRQKRLKIIVLFLDITIISIIIYEFIIFFVI